MSPSSSPYQFYRILIWSHNPDKLMPYYRDILKLPLEKKLDMPGDYGYFFIINHDLRLWIGRHSDIKGKNKDPFRHMFNLYVKDSVAKRYQSIKDHPQTTIVAKPFKAPFSTPGNEIWFCTFLDPENNCLQFVGPK